MQNNKNFITGVKFFPFLIVLLLLAPTLAMVWKAFFPYGNFTLEAFSKAFSENRINTLLINTLSLSLGVVGVSFLLGLPISILLFRTDLPCRGMFFTFFLAAASLPLHVAGTAWLSLTGRAGIMTKYIHLVWPGFSIYSLGGAVWVMGVAYTPLVILMLGVILRSVDPLLEEEGLLYLSGIGVFWRVTLRCSALGFLGAGLVVFALSSGEISITDLFRVRTFAEEIYTLFAMEYRPDIATALFIPFLLPFLFLTLFIFYVAKERGRVTVWGILRHPLVFSLNSYRWTAFSILVFLSTIFAVPLLSLFITVGSLNNLFEDIKVVLDELWVSLVVSAGAAVLSTVLAFLMSRSLIHNFKTGWAMLPFLLWLLILPAPIVGIGLIHVFNRDFFGGIYDSYFILVLASTIRFIPFAMLAIFPVILRIPREMEESALLEGSNWWKVLCKVFLPLSFPGILLSFSLVFLFSMGELGASVLVVPPGCTTLTIRIFNLLHYGVRSTAASATLVLVGIVFSIVAGTIVCLRLINRLIFQPG